MDLGWKIKLPRKFQFTVPTESPNYSVPNKMYNEVRAMGWHSNNPYKELKTLIIIFCIRLVFIEF